MTTIDLSAISGLPLALDETTGLLSERVQRPVSSVQNPGLVAAGPIFREEPGQRRFRDLRSVVAEPDAIDPIADETAYFTYRDVRAASETGLAANGLRYDITVTLPGTVGGEYVKTTGHYHGLDASGVSWPEIYDVLSGEAAFVLQKAEDEPSGDPAVTRAVVVVAFPGDRLVIPPDYGHVTVNIGATPLVVADLVAVASVNHYESYVTRRGGAIRITAVADEEDAFEAEWNHNYPEVDDGIEVIAASDLVPFEADTPLYLLGTEHPEKVVFLTNPSLSSFQV